MAWEIPKNFVTARPGRLHGGGNHISKLLKFLLITEYGLISKIQFLTVFFRLQIRLHTRKMIFQPYFPGQPELNRQIPQDSDLLREFKILF